MLFWCRVSRVVLRSSAVARLSMFLKRSMAEMPFWILCLGRSSFDTHVSFPLSSQRNSMGQQSWPWRCRKSILKWYEYFSFICAWTYVIVCIFHSYRSNYTVLWNKNDTEKRKKLRLQLRRTKHKHVEIKIIHSNYKQAVHWTLAREIMTKQSQNLPQSVTSKSMSCATLWQQDTIV